MAAFLFRVLILCGFLAVSLISSSQALTCTSQKFTNNKLYNHCSDLTQLSSYLHWTYDASKSSLSIAFVSSPSKTDGWISWAINPTSTGMAGSQTLVAFKDSNGSMVVKTYNISSYSSILESKLSFDVTDMTADYSNGQMRIFAAITLPESLGTTINQVWQIGPAVTDGFPAKHDFLAQNLASKGTLDLLNGQSNTASGTDSRTKRKNIHGILNGVSWGILFPVGVIIARYLRTFESADPAWFYLHASCQLSAYAIGVAGWVTGLKLGSESVGVQYSDHRNLGITLFSLATVQMCALFLRPKKEHKFRLYWNIYHHSIGYTIIVISIINILKGFHILSPEKMWKSAYIAVILAIGGLAIVLEAITWIIVLRRKKTNSK
ncbi:cytochrome b561 and DOMON domain-containing protein At3g25290-like [Impatiens glandulifera]|uniref:cytochrome b561 and DOMON domain-containing protein At3g25290-like n=1 Tax=Impatiens glandulifera TaxID=253017 RepID=UPI001FB0E019|nr:cytochrome b561 and DOMON domain-containing protein At3g25290-like [Impatiens glandulifera]